MSEPEEDKAALDPVSTPFKQTLSGLMEHVQDLIRANPKKNIVLETALMLGKGGLRLVSERQVIDEFVMSSFEHWSQIKERNVEYFRNHLASILGRRAPKVLSDLFTAFVLEQNPETGEFVHDFTPFWLALDELVVTSIRNVHARRDWGPLKKGGVGYRKKILPLFPLQHLADQWGVSLNKDVPAS